jgi:hypothetical protein
LVGGEVIEVVRETSHVRRWNTGLGDIAADSHQPSFILTLLRHVIGPNPVVEAAAGHVDHYFIRVCYVQGKVMIVVMKKAAQTPERLLCRCRKTVIQTQSAQE